MPRDRQDHAYVVDLARVVLLLAWQGRAARGLCYLLWATLTGACRAVSAVFKALGAAIRAVALCWAACAELVARHCKQCLFAVRRCAARTPCLARSPCRVSSSHAAVYMRLSPLASRLPASLSLCVKLPTWKLP